MTHDRTDGHDTSYRPPMADPDARQDRAIERSDDDALDRGPFVDSLIRAVVHTEQDLRGTIVRRHSTGFVVGLTGEWGLGKSSVLNLVKERLDSYDHVAVVSINPWLFKSRDDLLKAYFGALRDALGKTLRERARAVQVQLDRYKGAIGVGGSLVAAGIDMHGGAGVAGQSWKLWGRPALEKVPKPVEPSPEEERKSLEAKLKAARIAVVVLIDELDRVEDDEVRAVAQLVKAVGDIKGISYLVAYDPKRVAQALGRGSTDAERMTSGEAYLEKVIQFALPLRPLFEEDVRALLAAALRDNAASLPAAKEEYQTAIIEALVGSARTPREIKRLIGSFAVLEQIVNGEICPFDVLGYSWVATKAPAVREALARNLDAMINDPGEREMLRRLRNRGPDGKKKESLEDLLGAAAVAHEGMLKLLFPRFGSDDGTNAGNRIGRRRNLVRLLYLGDPPGMMSRQEIERLWSIDTIEDSEKAIRSLLVTERLAGLLDRLPDLMERLPAVRDAVFWPALARSLVREHDWITGPEALVGLVEDAAEMLWRLRRTDGNNEVRLRGVFESLTADGDLLIAPWLLRKHLFAHGLNAQTASGSGAYVFTKEETMVHAERELPRYCRAILEGTFLKRLPDTDVLYAILDGRRWTDELRASMTDQLNRVEAMATFAALTVRPGYISDRATMNEIIDGDVVLARLVEMAKDEVLPTEPWLLASLKRLAATLRGHDPHFVRDYAAEDYIAAGLPSRGTSNPTS